MVKAQRWRPRLDVLVLLFCLLICIWLGTNNYSLHTLVQEKEEELKQNQDTTQTHMLRIDTQLTQIHTHADTIKTEYNSLNDLLQATLRKQAQEVSGLNQKLTNTEHQLREAKKTLSDLEKKHGDLVASIPVDHSAHLVQASTSFKNGSIALSVIVALDWDGSKDSVRSLSIMYVLDYFNNVARKDTIAIEMIFVRPAASTTIAPEFILTNNLVSEFRTVNSGSLEAMLNEAASSANGKHLLFIPMLPSLRSTLDIELSLDVKKMLGQFKDSDVGIVGGIVASSEDDTIVNAGIDFARSTKDAVTPFARFVGAGLHYEKKNEKPPCVSRWGMMINKDVFYKAGGFQGTYTISGRPFSITQLMEDGDLCLRVLTYSKKIIYDPESSVKANTLPSPTTYYYQQNVGDLLVKFDTTWSSIAGGIIDDRKEIKDFMLVWDLYCGCTGVNVEAISYLVALENKLDVGAVAGENCWCGGFPTYVHESLIRISSRIIGPKVDVWVSHKPPDKYPSFPYKGLVNVKDRPTRIIGRSMSETDTIMAKWVEDSTKADEIWVPTEFHREVFTVSGVDSKKLTVIEESLDTTLYDPAHTKPLPLDPRYESTFKFLSVFKWETRKGWDLLLKAYFEEFVGDVDNVVLVLQTYLYKEKYPRDKKNAESKVKAFGDSLNLTKKLPPVLVLTDELPELQMPQLYKACDAFVLPTRGEGWGLPVMEAMSMSLPAIVTNWSGPTQFTTKDTAYLLPYEVLETVPYTFEAGSGVEKWAKPSLSQLKQLMRSIYTQPQQAKEVGKLARQHIVENYDREIVAKKMVDRLKEIQKLAPSK